MTDMSAVLLVQQGMCWEVYLTHKSQVAKEMHCRGVCLRDV